MERHSVDKLFVFVSNFFFFSSIIVLNDRRSVIVGANIGV